MYDKEWVQAQRVLEISIGSKKLDHWSLDRPIEPVNIYRSKNDLVIVDLVPCNLELHKQS